MKKIACCLFFLAFEIVSAQTDLIKKLETVQFPLLDGKMFSGGVIKKNTATVFIFLLPDCPACQNYSLTLNRLYATYKSNGIAFYGVFPGLYNTAAEMKEFQTDYQISFPLMKDPGKKLVTSVGAKLAPEVFVVNSTGVILYHGRIDDWVYAVGKKKMAPLTHELQDALEAVVHHQPVKVSHVHAVGCIIE